MVRVITPRRQVLRIFVECIKIPVVSGFVSITVLLGGVIAVLTEAQVQRSFRKMLNSEEKTPELFDKAEALIDQLRLESPLRHRLSEELEELRQMCVAKD